MESQADAALLRPGRLSDFEAERSILDARALYAHWANWRSQHSQDRDRSEAVAAAAEQVEVLSGLMAETHKAEHRHLLGQIISDWNNLVVD